MNLQEIDYAYNNSVFELQSDFKPETIAALLIHKGIKAEQIILRSIGTSSRSYNKDVSDITVKNINEIDHVFIDSAREGIYDSLPESIFHSFSSSQSDQNTLDIIDEIKRHREEELHARNFFLPFEQEFFNIKRALISFEEDFESHSDASLLIRIFKPYFTILHSLDAKKGYLFIRMIPYIHEIRNDFKKIAEYLEILLDCTVRLKEHITKKKHTLLSAAMLGSASLGEDFIIGNEILDGEFDLCVSIQSKNSNHIKYERTHNLNQLTHALCDYFFNAQYTITVVYEHTPSDINTVLDGNNLLGISLVCI